MWISQRGEKAQRHTGGGAEMGRVTLAGNPVGVYLDGERRELPMFGPEATYIRTLRPFSTVINFI